MGIDVLNEIIYLENEGKKPLILRNLEIRFFRKDNIF